MMMKQVVLVLSLALWVGAASAETVFTGETIQGARVISQLDVADLAPGAMHRSCSGAMSGTAIALIGPSRQGVENITRTWTINDLGGAQINPNRTWPGREDGNTVERHSWLIEPREVDAGAAGVVVDGDVDVAPDQLVHEYLAPADGRVAIIGIDAATERGGEIATILVKRESCDAEECTDGGITP